VNKTEMTQAVCDACHFGVDLLLRLRVGEGRGHGTHFRLDLQHYNDGDDVRHWRIEPRQGELRALHRQTVKAGLKSSCNITCSARVGP
jgi:hypothetical protein